MHTGKKNLLYKKTKLRKLPPQYTGIVMPLFLSIFMTFISTFRSIGLADHFFTTWEGSWLLSWIIAFPTLLLILPVVKKLASLIVAPLNKI